MSKACSHQCVPPIHLCYLDRISKPADVSFTDLQYCKSNPLESICVGVLTEGKVIATFFFQQPDRLASILGREQPLNYAIGACAQLYHLDRRTTARLIGCIFLFRLDRISRPHHFVEGVPASAASLCRRIE